MIAPLSDALAERGYDTLTPVQQAVADPDLATSDLLVSAQTGSGKTVGFGLAIAPTILGEATHFGPAAAPLALVIAPTRELAFQVMRELGWLYAKTGARVTSCVGGMDTREERRALDRGAHIVVGTPGRLRDHIERGSLDMSGLRAVVLDEADEMLDLGFREDLEFMLCQAPEDRRTLLFSATVSPGIAKLAGQYQRDARRISTIGSAEQHADITYQAVRVAASDSEHAIFNLLRFRDDESAIVFANTRAAVSHLTARLANRGFAVVSLSGELSQSERTHALQAMRDGRARICVATDVAARGIDLPNLNLVIHADLPTNTESLLHRSGRTGRAGRKGISALIVPPKAVKKTERLLQWAKIKAEWCVAPSAEDIFRRDEERLVADPAWDQPATEAQAAFAARLLARHSAEAIAAAYLRLYHSRQSAPEELLPPDTKSAPRDHADFGPRRWFALSVGRDDQAEARWILPLLCRAGNLDRSAIGAIRVQASETLVEIAERSVGVFLAALGPDRVLERGITVRQFDEAPDQPPAGHAPKRERAPFREERKERKPKFGESKPWPGKNVAPRREEPTAVGGAEREHASTTVRKPSESDGKPVREGKAAPAKGKMYKTQGGKDWAKPASKAKGKTAKTPPAERDASERPAPVRLAKAGPRKPGKKEPNRDGGHKPPHRGKR
ncbi:DEAD/DEAH box helicase [Defluviimonas sp. WL0024]|uniref:DEAD/DEAH box helicase n=1 Tax=Albidovulum salinarum TaxID=2984153 RepID=A0ABT2X357_9RHOB|nr:DEAD/DEAH box helicase [Defluviimonas sp. WL0024]MCU9848385.1 DEAD/DEAH box helicase [Defluviimonas sp. WL0024]